MNEKFRDYLLLHFIVFIWGFAAILGVLIDLPSLEIVFIRTLLATLGLFFIIKLGKRSWRLRRKDHSRIIFVGFLFGIHWILFFLSVKISNVSICLAGLATTPLWTSILEPVFFKYKIRKYEIVLSLVALSGMITILNVELDHITGMILAILSALSAAVFTIINASVVKRNDHFVITFYEMMIAAGSTILLYPVYMFFFPDNSMILFPRMMDWVYLLVLAGACTVFAYSYSTKLMRRLSAFSVNLSVNLEPVYGIIFALLIFGDRELMSSGFYFGTTLILVSVLAYPLINRRFKRKPLETDILR